VIRRTFLQSSVAAATCAAVALPAGATGGLDDFRLPAQPNDTIRILLGRGLATPIDADSFSFGSRVFRGTFTTAPDGQVVNVVPVEAYLYGVVPMESPPSWPAATLQAQAIVARTFALARRNPKRAYDVVASERDQAYGGLHAEFATSTAAVDATAGQIVTFETHPASVSYMSCCGGHTESPAEAWQGGADLPYLRGVADPYCSASPDYQWTKSVPFATLQNVVSSLGSLGTLRSASIAASDPSGRARSLRFVGEQGEAEVPAAEFRRAASVPSLLIRNLRADGDTLTVEGAGRGHGVGLCQWGARGLGMQGADARTIVAFYFPGTSVNRVG